MRSNRTRVNPTLQILICILGVGGLSGPLVAGEGLEGSPQDAKGRQTVTGRVFADKNASGVFDEGDCPLESVRVSNGRDVVLTDANGRYVLGIDGEAEVFVIKPRDYQVPRNNENLPQFYYLHRPNGSAATRFAGVAPTGPLPASVDFPLTPAKEPDEFSVVVFGDPQPRNIEEIDYAIQDVVEELVAEGIHKTAAFGISLGDIAFDDLNSFEPLNAAIAQIGLPWINVLGNHDSNYDAPHVSQSFETFQRMYGPSYYAFDYGPAHFVVLNTVTWHEGEERRHYLGGLHEDQRSFIANNLAHVSRDTLVVFLMHIPFVDSTRWNDGELEAFYRIIEDRPHTLSFAAHTHSHKHWFLDETNGWRSSRPHHHIIHGTICGAWWSGPPDEYGVPPTMMADGTPNGYGILTIKGNTYRHRYKVFRRPADFQMHIQVSETPSADGDEPQAVFANIFNAWPDADVKMRVGREGTWWPMERTLQTDPVFVAYRARSDRVAERPWRDPPQPGTCRHLWTAQLPEGLTAGVQLLEIQASNPDGQVFRGIRVIRVPRSGEVSVTVSDG